MTIPAGQTGNIQALSEKYGKTPFFLGWHEIRHLLYDSLLDGVVEFDKQVCQYSTQYLLFCCHNVSACGCLLIREGAPASTMNNSINFHGQVVHQWMHAHMPAASHLRAHAQAALCVCSPVIHGHV